MNTKMLLPAEPYKILQLPNGTTVPFYIIAFDKNGVCQSPETVKSLKGSLKGCSDLYMFCHGWNNDWAAATAAYQGFISGYMNMRLKNSLAMGDDYHPVLVGLFWPSAILVHDDEQAPGFQSLPSNGSDDLVLQRSLSDFAESLSSADAALFYKSMQKSSLSESETEELAQLLTKKYNADSDDVPAKSMSADVLVDTWQLMESEFEDPFAGMWMTPNSDETKVQSDIGDLAKQISVRNVLRTLTVWQMKDRAGVVGRNGVHDLLVEVLDGTSCKTHLIGHSYGTKVLMSAAYEGTLPRKVRSALLLQGAVSHLAFAQNVANTGKPGGFINALDRVELPILSTYSEHDFPLTRVFHLALRRSKDLGEVAAIDLDHPPSIFAALGGFGPRGIGSNEELQMRIPIHDVGTPYDLDKSKRVYGLMATRTIGGHGDISNPSTWWALYALVSHA